MTVPFIEACLWFLLQIQGKPSQWKWFLHIHVFYEYCTIYIFIYFCTLAFFFFDLVDDIRSTCIHCMYCQYIRMSKFYTLWPCVLTLKTILQALDVYIHCMYCQYIRMSKFVHCYKFFIKSYTVVCMLMCTQMYNMNANHFYRYLNHKING